MSLHLQRCKIAEVEGGAFSGMKGLIYLYLSENDLTALSPDAFKGLSQGHIQTDSCIHVLELNGYLLNLQASLS